MLQQSRERRISFKARRGCARALDGIADHTEITRPATPQRQSAKRAGEIGTPAQLRAQNCTHRLMFKEVLNRIEAFGDGIGLGQRAHEPRCQLPRRRRP